MRMRALGFPAVLAGFGLMGLLWTSSASAQYSQGPITTSTPIGPTLTDWSSPLLFTQFNPSLGTLQSVTLDLSGGVETQLTVSNNSESSSSGTASTECQIEANDLPGSPVVTMSILAPAAGFSYSLGAGDNVTSGTLSGTGSFGQTYTDAPTLSEFTGAGTFALPVFTFTQTLLANTGGNTSASQITDASLTGTVTYNYVVPEPASLSLIMVTLPLLASRRRRRA